MVNMRMVHNVMMVMNQLANDSESDASGANNEADIGSQFTPVSDNDENEEKNETEDIEMLETPGKNVSVPVSSSGKSKHSRKS